MIDFIVNWAGIALALFCLIRFKSKFALFMIAYYAVAMALGNALVDQEVKPFMQLISSGHSESANYELWRAAQDMLAGALVWQFFSGSNAIAFYTRIVCLKAGLQALYAIELSLGSYWLFWPVCVIDHLTVIIEIITMIIITNNRISRWLQQKGWNAWKAISQSLRKRLAA